MGPKMRKTKEPIIWREEVASLIVLSNQPREAMYENQPKDPLRGGIVVQKGGVIECDAPYCVELTARMAGCGEQAHDDCCRSGLPG